MSVRMIPTKLLAEFLVRCLSCNFDQKMTTGSGTLQLGDIVMPEPGYGEYFGRCRKCGRSGLKVIKRSD